MEELLTLSGQDLAARIRRRIAAGKADEAKQLIEELRSLARPAELSQLLNEQRQELTSPDPKLQEKIDQLFAQTESLMSKYLDPAEANRLRRELETGKGSE